MAEIARDNDAQCAVIGTPLQSLVVGYYDPDEKLICVGKVPGGLTPQNRRELHRVLRPLHADVCPFSNLPNAQRKSITGGGITLDPRVRVAALTRKNRLLNRAITINLVTAALTHLGKVFRTAIRVCRLPSSARVHKHS